ncbi:MAG: hypothetical protein GY716_05690 [bacterium]|nr:hypothetical protein [bacterium]
MTMSPRVRTVLGGAALAAFAAWSSATEAGTRRSLPEGIKIGPVVVNPYIAFDYAYNDNVFYDPDDPEINEEGPRSDRVREITGRVTALLPLRRSEIELFYEASRFEYEEFSTDFSRETSGTTGAVFDLRFSSNDRLRIRETYETGLIDVQVFDGADEQVFVGQGYDSNVFRVELSRSVPRRQGYSIRIDRVDFVYDEFDRETGYFDYRGFETNFEYRQPLASNKWITGSYGARRFNHYDRSRDGIEYPVGVPFRKEESDTYELGLRGTFGERQPFVFKLGQGKYTYEGAEDSEFTGVVGQARVRLRVGGRSQIDLDLSRGSYPSTVSSFYVRSALGVVFERSWRQFSSIGIDSRLARNLYDSSTTCSAPGSVPGNPQGNNPNPVRRDDRLLRFRAYVDFVVHPRMGIRISGDHRRRNSQCQDGDYATNIISTAFVVGWF